MHRSRTTNFSINTGRKNQILTTLKSDSHNPKPLFQHPLICSINFTTSPRCKPSRPPRPLPLKQRQHHRSPRGSTPCPKLGQKKSKFRPFYAKPLSVDVMMSRHSYSWSSVMTRGGAKRILSPWVGLASSPLSRSFRQTSHASTSRKGQKRGQNREWADKMQIIHT